MSCPGTTGSWSTSLPYRSALVTADRDSRRPGFHLIQAVVILLVGIVDPGRAVDDRAIVSVFGSVQRSVVQGTVVLVGFCRVGGRCGVVSRSIVSSDGVHRKDVHGGAVWRHPVAVAVAEVVQSAGAQHCARRYGLHYTNLQAFTDLIFWLKWFQLQRILKVHHRSTSWKISLFRVFESNQISEKWILQESKLLNSNPWCRSSFYVLIILNVFLLAAPSQDVWPWIEQRSSIVLLSADFENESLS